MAESTSSEDMVVVIDSSFSMFRHAFDDQSRILKALFAAETIIKKKIEIDDKDRYDVVLFGDHSKALNKMVFTAGEIKDYIVDSLEFKKKSIVSKGFAKALQSLINQKRFIGEKQSRILIISDGLVQIENQNPLDLAKLAKEMGIVIDVLRFGPARIPGNLLRKTADITGGKYYYVSSQGELVDAINEIAEKKKIQHSTIFDKDKEDSLLAQEMNYDIAAVPLKLEELTEEQRKQAVYGFNDNNGDESENKKKSPKNIVCTICYSNKDMKNQVSFFGTGRFCPNCLATFHLDCVMEWSKQQQKKKVYDPRYMTYRCPHCFYLMKVPYVPFDKKASEDAYGKSPKFEKKNSDTINGRNVLCTEPDCAAIIVQNEVDSIIQCTVCNSIYHEDCAKKIWNKDKRCIYCNSKVQME